MGKGPIEIAKTDCGNGKKTVVVREREYQLASWAGVRVLGTVIAAVVSIIFAVLTAYYTAEASQNERIVDNDKKILKVDERENARHDALEVIFTRMNKVMDDQQKIMQKTNDTLIKVHTTQQHIQKQVDTMSEDIKQLRKP